MRHPFSAAVTRQVVVRKEAGVTTNSPSLEYVWARIKSLEGERFETKTGKEFTYTVKGEVFRVSRANQNISKQNFRKALDLVPLDGPGEIRTLVRGSAYVWAVLHDQRIRQGDW